MSVMNVGVGVHVSGCLEGRVYFFFKAEYGIRDVAVTGVQTCALPIWVFNRSHYEDVLAVRVHRLAPEPVWRRRYAQLNEFERMLVEEGTGIRKLFLHVSKGEQLKRLEERLDDPAKSWKFEAADLEERALWDEYTAAYEEMLEQCST